MRAVMAPAPGVLPTMQRRPACPSARATLAARWPPGSVPSTSPPWCRYGCSPWPSPPATRLCSSHQKRTRAPASCWQSSRSRRACPSEPAAVTLSRNCGACARAAASIRQLARRARHCRPSDVVVLLWPAQQTRAASHATQCTPVLQGRAQHRARHARRRQRHPRPPRHCGRVVCGWRRGGAPHLRTRSSQRQARAGAAHPCVRP